MVINMRINYNISSIIARNALNNNDTRLADSIERLSSGLKINSAADDAAGLAVSRKMNAQLRSLEQANQNANDGVSVVNTADGAMAEMHDLLQRMNELSVQAANGTNADTDREQIQLEIDGLVAEIDRIADTTEFNAQNLLDGSFAYKGYTNNENVKVMSYDDGVESGVYAIGNITYTCYESVTTYADNDKHTKTSTTYKIDNMDAVEDALMTKTDLEAYNVESGEYKAFPDGAKVALEDNKLTITAENDFEVKLTLNNRDDVIDDNTIRSVTQEKTVTTINYKSVQITDANGNTYAIDELNYSSEDGYYAGENDTNNISLKEDLSQFLVKQYPGVDTGDITIGDISYDDAGDTLTVTINGNAHTFNVGTATNDTKTLNDYLNSTTVSQETQYSIGSADAIDNCLKLDLTGMGPMRVQIGANEGQVMEIEIPTLRADNLGIAGLDISTQDAATASIEKVSKAINQLSGVRAKIGAYTNRLEHTITNLNTTEENMTAAYSRIMDVDMAKEMTEYSTVQVLVQSSTSMLSQANERPQQVLQLLQ